MERITTKSYFIPSLIFFFFLGFYLFTAKGTIHISDNIVNFQTTRAIVEDGSLAISCDFLPDFIVARDDGLCFSKYDIGLSITAVPLYLLGRVLGPDPLDMFTISFPRLSVSMLGSIGTAATCALLYILCLHISNDEQQSFIATILYGIVTIAWPYAGLFFSQTLIAFLLTLAVLLIIKYPPSQTWAYVGAGLALGWACLTRIDTLPLAAVVFIYVLYRWKQAQGNGRLLFKNLFLLGTPIFLAILAYLAVNAVRTGSLLQSGYANEGWTTPFFTGLYGLLISPGKGVVFFSPLAVLAVIGFVKLWQQGWRAETALILGLVITQLLFYSPWWAWDGGHTWGPRFLVSTHALLMVGLLPWISKSLPQLPLIIAIIFSFLVQLTGTVTEVVVYMRLSPFSWEEILFKWEASPIWGQFQHLLNRKISFLIANQGHGLLSRTEVFLWLIVCLALMITPLLLLRNHPLLKDQPSSQ